MTFTEEGYYTLRGILGYNAKYNIVLSDRGRGKSFDAKHFLMAQDGEFMCLYRQEGDMMSAISDWIKPLITSRKNTNRWALYEAADFRFDGNTKEGFTLYYQDQPKGFFRHISAVNRIKQEVFPDTLNWVWLDEFIPLAWKKLQGVESEGDAIRTIIKTIEHDTVQTREEKGLRPVRMIMFANPFNWNNPILSYFHINGLLGPGIHRAGPGVVWELLEPFQERKKTKKMTVDEFLGDEVNKNMGFVNQAAFVAPIPKGSVPYLSLRIKRKYFTIYKFGMKYWVRGTTQHVDIRSQYNGSVLMKFGSMDGLQEDEMSVEGTAQFTRFKSLAAIGKLYYEDINVKFDFLNAINAI